MNAVLNRELNLIGAIGGDVTNCCDGVLGLKSKKHESQVTIAFDEYPFPRDNSKIQMQIFSSFFILPVFFFLAFQAQAFSGEIATLTDFSRVSHSKPWLNLLHYGDGWVIRKNQSRVDDPGFFISPKGVRDPEAELQADLKAFNNPLILVTKNQVPAACAFPARKEFLARTLSLNFPSPDCPKLSTYLEETESDSVSMIFSTAYPNNPSSMFGHTFLKFSNGKRPDLLQPSISYAAVVGEDGGMIFMIRGLFGGYPGGFALAPYYAKINEYIRSESRDLWEYELNLTSAEIKTARLHLWELQASAGMDYYFFDENCAYILMRVLEIAKPEWDLSGNRLFTIPGATVRTLMDHGDAVKNIKFKPSARRQWHHAYDLLSPDEKELLKAIFAEERGVLTLTNTRVIDTALIQVQYLKLNDTPLAKSLRMRRSQFKDPPLALPDLSNEVKNRPDLGHAPMQLSLGGGELRSLPFANLGFKFAFHDLLNSDLGFESFSHIDFPSINLRYIKTEGLTVDHVGLIAITSLFPWNSLEKKRSWKLSIDYRTPSDLSECTTCHVAHGDYGMGISLNPFTEKVVTAGFASVYAEAGSTLSFARLGPKAEWLSVINPWSWYKLLFDLSCSLDAFQSKRKPVFFQAELKQSINLARDFDLRVSMKQTMASFWREKISDEWDASFQIYW